MKFWRLSLCLLLRLLLWEETLWAGATEGVTYTNFTRPGPIEIHMVRIPRRSASLEFQSIHSGGKPIGRSPLSEQIKRIESGTPIAAINGDFFQLDGSFAGDPRGLQIVNGALISAPAGNGSFWTDAEGQPHIALTRSSLRITWPNGSSLPLVLNAACGTNQCALYTGQLNHSRENIGREFVSDPEGNAVLRVGESYSLTVREPSSASPELGHWIVAIGKSAIKKVPEIRPGAVVKISTATVPNLYGVSNAISGGPILVVGGRQKRFDTPGQRFATEKHPRSALGWSDQEFFWVEVDGRQQTSVGMTLNELGALMVELGCVEAMNLDGGGSSTLWFDGKVRNRPSEGAERPIANVLALVRKPAPPK